MIWIIENHEDLKYNMEIQNSDWMTGGRLYNTSINKKLHIIVFEAFVINEITGRYNIMCYIVAYEREDQ